MFAFGAVINEVFEFVQDKGVIYSYPTESLALEYFDCIKEHSHLYRLDDDLAVARLQKQGENGNPAPVEVEPTEEQKLALWSNYVYKSLLAWAPFPENLEVPEEVV